MGVSGEPEQVRLLGVGELQRSGQRRAHLGDGVRARPCASSPRSTASVTHLRENLAAVDVVLPPAAVATLDGIAGN